MELFQVAKLRREINKYKAELKDSPEYAEAFHKIIGSDINHPPLWIEGTQSGVFRTRGWLAAGDTYEALASQKYEGDFDYCKGCALLLLIQECYPGVYEFPNNTVSEIRNGARIRLVMYTSAVGRSIFPRFSPLNPNRATLSTVEEMNRKTLDQLSLFQAQMRNVLYYMSRDAQAVERYSHVIFRHLEQRDFKAELEKLVGEDGSHPPKYIKAGYKKGCISAQCWDPMAEYYEMVPQDKLSFQDFYVLCAFVLYIQKCYPGVYEFAVERGMVGDVEPRISLSMRESFYGKPLTPAQNTVFIDSGSEPSAAPQGVNADLEVSLSQEPPRFCASCGTRLAPGAAFCGVCGSKIP